MVNKHLNNVCAKQFKSRTLVNREYGFFISDVIILGSMSIDGVKQLKRKCTQADAVKRLLVCYSIVDGKIYVKYGCGSD